MKSDQEWVQFEKGIFTNITKNIYFDYFTGEHCEIANFAISKHNKIGLPYISEPTYKPPSVGRTIKDEKI